ncbi:MAG: dihydrolipoyl dehydrogenase family protein [Planctomycetota bacterium]
MVEHAEYDVVVVGSGGAGQTVAFGAAADGAKVAVVEEDGFGGVCPLRGCDPKRLYWEVGEALRRVRAIKAIRGSEGLSWHWQDSVDVKHQMSGEISAKAEARMRDAGIDCLRGQASFMDPHQMVVGRYMHVRGKRFLLACGMRPRPLDFHGAELAIGNREFLEMDTIPATAVCIGDGYVGMEFASILATAGARVRVICPHDRPLQAFDPVLVRRMIPEWERQGIAIDCGRRAVEVRTRGRKEACFQVRLDDDSWVEADLVVHGAGRVGNGDRLDPEQAGLQLDDEQRLLVDERCRCIGTDHIWAVGDCASGKRPPLTPVAVHEAQLVLQQWRGSAEICRRETELPSIVFTHPVLVRIGSPIEAVAHLPDVDVIEKDWSSSSHMRRLGEEQAGIRLAIDRKRERLLGAHLLGPGMEEVANMIAVFMQQDLPLGQCRQLIAGYPTVGFMVAPLLA